MTCGHDIVMWTYDVPTVPGHYWWNPDDERNAESEVVYVTPAGAVLHLGISDVDRKKLRWSPGKYWPVPLEKPTF